MASAIRIPDNFDAEPKLVDCIKLLCNNNQFSDVQFEFPDENTKIYCHKFILSVRSSVFRTMFYGAVTEVTSNDNIVKIEDVSSASFMEMVKFIYTDEVNMTDDNIVEVIYVAHKYSIKSLEQVCYDYLENKLDEDNCCKCLERFYVYDNDFTKKCLKIIDASISGLMEKGKLNELSEKPLLMVLKRDSLDVNELDLFKELLNWAKTSCEIKDIEATVHNMREKFAVFEMVRFPTMSISEIVECHRIGNKFFTAEETLSLFNYKSDEVITDSLRYSTINRDIFGASQNMRFWETGHVSESSCSTLTFRVNEIVKVEIPLDFKSKNVEVCDESAILFKFEDTDLITLILSPNVEYKVNIKPPSITYLYHTKSNDVFNFTNSFTCVCRIDYRLRRNK